MKYKLKKSVSLTKLQLHNTSWIINDAGKSASLQLYILSRGIDFYNTTGIQHTPFNVIISINNNPSMFVNLCDETAENNDYFELKNFDDYFKKECDWCTLGCWRCVASLHPCSVEATYIKDAGTFTWAVEQMSQGKKIRRSKWLAGVYNWYKSKELPVILEEDNSDAQFSMDDFESTDWEIYEENKFGDYEALSTGHLWMNGYGTINKDKFDYIINAIKRARRIDNEY